MMNETRRKSIKRIQNERNRQKAYDIPIVNKDMKANDEAVRKFYESLKG